MGVGDVDNAERVGVTMGGLNTRVSSSVGDMVKEAGIQRAKAAELRERAGWPNYDAVASIAWLGYDAPDGLKDVMHDWSARDAAGPLNRFDKGLAATTNVSDQHITAFGHSYGSLVTSLALQQGHRSATSFCTVHRAPSSRTRRSWALSQGMPST